MKISHEYSYKPSFGYNKLLNDELKAELKNYPDKKWSQSISSLNSYCNKLEGLLNSEEKNKNQDKSRFNDYLNTFLTCKELLTGYVVITFENLNFANREYEEYNDEFVKNGSNKGDWREKALKVLSGWIDKKDDTPVKEASATENTSNAEIVTDKKALTNTALLSKNSFLEEYKPSDTSPKGFDDVSGMDNLKQNFNEGILQLIRNPQQAKADFDDYGIKIPRGIMLYGPPGCGKTYITEALAYEAKLPLYILSLGKASSHYINLTSKNIHAAIDEAVKIAQDTKQPCLLFMDEVDTLAFDRTSRTENEDIKQVGTLLQAMDKAEKGNVFIIAATNKINLVDPAVKRRFTSLEYVDVPDLNSRISLLKKILSNINKGKSLLNDENQLVEIAKELNGYSNDSICKIAAEAAKHAKQRNRAEISSEDYYKAISQTNEQRPNRRDYAMKDDNKESIAGFKP